MAITVKHKFVSSIPDSDDTSVVRPSNWNDDHQLTGTVPIANGGTGASDASTALTNLGAYPASNPSGYGTGTVTSVTGTSPVNVATGTTTPVISLSTTGSGNVVLATGATQAHPTISDYETFTPISAPSYVEGELWYDSTQKALAYYNDVTNNTVHIGQEVQLKVINNTGSSIANGTPVYVTGTSSGQSYPNIALAQANASSTSAVLGLTNGTIASGATGYVCTAGLLTPCNTGSFSVGQVLYLSPYSAGQLMNTVPPTGYAVQVGVVAYANSPNGSIYVKQTTPLAVSASTIVGQVSVANGGTGASTLTGYVKGSGTSALTASSTIPNTDISGLGTMSTQNASAVTITGGTIDNAVIGATTPAAGTFTTITGQTEVLKGTGQNLLTNTVSLATTWTQSNITVTGSQSDPFGGTTAFLLNDGTNAGVQHTFYQSTSYASNTYTLSIYAKAGTANYLGLYSSSQNAGVIFNISTGAFSANIGVAPTSYSITSVGGGWYRCSITIIGAQTFSQFFISEDGTSISYTGTSKTVYVVAPQLEIGSVTNTYISTTSSIVYGTPTLSFSGVAGLGLQSDGSLYVSPAGTGALQAQATTSSATGGNARGANAVDLQTARNLAGNVASGQYSAILGGYGNSVVSSYSATTIGGYGNSNSGSYAFIGGGQNNGILSGTIGNYSVLVGGYSNNANGYYNFVGGGANNSGTSISTVTTQAAATNGVTSGSTAVTLAASNSSIKVGQVVTGTGIATYTYVAAISGTSLTLSQNASGTGTPTLSFYTPHGVVVGGGNNQATGSYSFIGGGGDAGTAANRNTASGDWSVVGGGAKNTASGIAAFVGGGGFYSGAFYTNTASGGCSSIVSGLQQVASGVCSFVGNGYNNNATALHSAIVAGTNGSTRGIIGNQVFPACNSPIAAVTGVTQAALLILAKQTTDATATVLTSDGGAAGTTNQVILPDNSAYYFKVSVIAGVTGGGNTKAWTLEGAIKRGSGVGTAAIVGTVTTTVVAADSGASTWSVTATADTTNGGLKITVTGQASTTIRWVARADTTEVTY